MPEIHPKQVQQLLEEEEEEHVDVIKALHEPQPPPHVFVCSVRLLYTRKYNIYIQVWIGYKRLINLSFSFPSSKKRIHLNFELSTASDGANLVCLFSLSILKSFWVVNNNFHSLFGLVGRCKM